LVAECVLFVGYSLPAFDTQARSKFLTAFQANDRCRWAAFNPNPAALSQFTRLFGRDKFTPYEVTLTGANNNLEDLLVGAFQV